MKPDPLRFLNCFLHARGMVVLHMLMCLVASAQEGQVRFGRFSADEGLPNNRYKQVIQARDGRIWMAGSDGLARYDGYNVVPFRHRRGDTTSLSGNNVSRIFEDREGRLWVGILGSGIQVLGMNKATFRRIALPESIGDLGTFSVVSFTQDSSGRIWVASNAGTFIIDEFDGQFLCEPFRKYWPGYGPDSVLLPDVLMSDNEGRVWAGTPSGLICFYPDAQTWMGPNQFKGLPVSGVSDIQEDREGRLWVSIRNQGPRMFYQTTDSLHFAPLNWFYFNSRTRPLEFAFDLDNRLWVSSFGDQVYGFDFRDSTVFLRTTINSDIAHERFFRAPFVDHSGDVWLPCEGFYIHKYPKGFQSYLHPFGFHQSNTCIYGEGNTLWLGYREKGLVRIDAESGESTLYAVEATPPHRIPVNHVQDVIKVSSGNMILVGFNNIAVMNPEGKVVHSYRLSGTNRAGFQDSKGRIWIGGYDGWHLFSETKGVLQSFALPSTFDDDRNYIQEFLEDPQGYLWMASDIKGLARLNPETGEVRQFLPHPGDTQSIPSSSIIDMDMDDLQRLWLATDVGLVCFDPVTFTCSTYDVRHGVTNDYMTAVICASDGQVWVSHHAGLSSFDPATHQFVNYSRGDGLLNTSYYPRSKFHSPEGYLYFGGKNGVDFFHPSRLRRNTTAPVMLFSSIQVNQHEQLTGHQGGHGISPLQLTHRDNLLEFEITGLHYTAQSEVVYYYMLEELHQDWVSLGSQRHILISGMKPGHYTFRAKAVSGDGITSVNPLVLPVHIRPPFYGTTGFRITGLLVLISAIFGIVKIREKNITRKERKEAAVNRKIAELEKRALQAQMNPHFIYNSMNSIQQFMIVHDVEGAMKYLTRFSRILRTVLNMSAQHRIPLYDELKLIEDYLELENMRFPDKFSYSIQVDPAINIHIVDIPPFFIQPQVENAIRHGLLKKSSPGHLLIDIRLHGPDLRITVEDNGIGRSASRAINGTEKRIGDSKGLAIMEERLSHLQPHHDHAPLTITDLFDEDRQPAGTRVEIHLPLD